MFSTIFPDGTCTQKVKEISVYCLVFNCSRGRDGKNEAGLPHSWLDFGFFIPSRDSALLVGQGVSFSSSFWDHCVWKQTFGWQAQTPGALQRSKASRDCRFRHHPSLAWQSERMHVSVPSLLLPSCCPTSPPFLSVAWSIFKPSILLGCRVLTKERHSAMSESSGWCGRQGGASKMLNTCTILYHLWNMYKKQCTFWNNKYLFNFWITASRSLKQNQKETDFPVIAAGKIFSV